MNGALVGRVLGILAAMALLFLGGFWYGGNRAELRCSKAGTAAVAVAAKTAASATQDNSPPPAAAAPAAAAAPEPAPAVVLEPPPKPEPAPAVAAPLFRARQDIPKAPPQTIPQVIPIVRAPDDPGVDEEAAPDEFSEQIGAPKAQAGGWRGFLSRWGS